MKVRSNRSQFAWAGWMCLFALACSSAEPTRPGPTDVGVPSTIAQTISESGAPFMGTFDLRNTGGCPMSWSATLVSVSGGAWLTATPLPTAEAPATLAAGATQAISYTMSVSAPPLPAPLAPGLYQSRLEIVATCTTTMMPASNSPATVLFNLRVSPLEAVLTVGPDIEKDVVTLTSQNGVTGTWRRIARLDGAAAQDEGTSAVWTGRKVLLFGGAFIDSGYVNSDNAIAFDPLTLTVADLPAANKPSPRRHQTAVWTGSEMIVWGGDSGITTSAPLNTGAVYNPATGWRTMATSGAPAARYEHQAVWTGSKMIVLAGANFPSGQATSSSVGGAFDPAMGSSGTWTGISPAAAPGFPISGAASFWSGRDVVLFYSTQPSMGFLIHDVARYSVATGGWSRGARSPNAMGAAAFSGAKALGWPSGQLYDIVRDVWSSATTSGAPPSPTSARSPIVAWTGSRYIVLARDAAGSTGVYNPSGAGSWAPGPSGVLNAVAAPRLPYVWTGKQLLVFVGTDVYSFE